ncbi:TetR/AcrR family transcriptional regulator [Streptomyces ziwulingensis]|uniref:TetR/AcrR family transcriptional regulator n=1 Tax=Streptomyces ziwulingensis TaxID=1045501 RepID=A0ABP9D114_9ACTN
MAATGETATGTLGGTESGALRADARRNRERIVTAAREVFMTQGVDAPMDEVARRARVGKGTLYRRFPDRDVLLEAVALDIYERLTAMARQAVEEGTSAWGTLDRFLREWAAFRFGLANSPLCHPMRDALRVNRRLRDARDVWLGLFERMVTDAQEAGVLRRDVGCGDIVLFMDRIVQETGAPADVADTVPARLLELVLDALRVQPGSVLPGRAITGADLNRPVSVPGAHASR